MIIDASPAAEYTDEELLRLLERSQSDPIFHIEEVQGVELIEDFQADLIRAVQKFERVAVRSCHNMGKTWTVAKLVLWFTSTHPGAKVVTTAPTARQVKLLLWSEIRAGFEKSRYPLGGEMGVQEWKISADWWAVGFTTQKEKASGQGQQNSGFQGIHAPWILVVFDEATGIPADVWKQLEGLLTSANVRFVAVGNPTTKACSFFNCFSDPTVKKLHFSCYDSRNLQANGIKDRKALEREYHKLLEMGEEERLERLGSYEVVAPHLLTCRWVMSMALKWRIDHPLFVSKAEGTFPEEDETCLMPLGVVEQAQRREPPKDIDGYTPRNYIGVDVARKGGDKSVLIRLRDTEMREVRVKMKRDLTVVTGEVIAMVNDLPDKEMAAGGVITVDATGIGSGVYDNLVEYKRANHPWKNWELREFHAAATWKVGEDGTEAEVKKRNERFVNQKAESFMLLGRDLKKELTLLDEDVFLEELPTIVYDYDSKGRYKMESKDDYKKRTGRGSPDHADSLALANYGRYHKAGIGEFTSDMVPKRQRRATVVPGRNSGDNY